MFDADLLEDLKQHILRIRPHNYGITANELAKETGVSAETARKKLVELEENGQLQKEEMICGGCPVKVYYKEKQ